MIKSMLKKVIKKFQKIEKKPVYIPVLYGNLLKNKIVLITGGTGGIGFAIAACCLNNGSKVIITGRNNDKVQRACAKLREDVQNSYSGNIKGLVLDLQNVGDFENILSVAIGLFEEKRIDVLVNNAGVMTGDHIGNTDERSFDEVINTNLKGTYFLSQVFSNYLIRNNIKGNILNISSSSGIRPSVSPYMLSKRGEIGLTLGLAKKLISHEIVVNGIAPGPTATDMLLSNKENIKHPSSPAGRYSTPEEIANMAVFLISDMGRMIVGETIYMTGGSGNLTLDDMYY